MAGKDRRKQLARQRYERQIAHRAAQQRRARRVKIIGSVVAIVLVAGAGVGLAAAVNGDSKPSKGNNAAPSKGDAATAGPAAAKPGECAYPQSPDPGAKKIGEPPRKPVYKGAAQATVKTDLGEMVMELDGAKAPCTVGSMAFLAKKNFFDHSKCHRLTTEGIKVLQCGDPTGTGTGGPGYRFANENTEGAKYTRGTLAMAHSAQPDSNGSQFFIVYGDSQLPPDYTVFGKVTSGMKVVDEVAKAGSDNANGAGDGAPKKPITIQDVAITRK